MAGGLTDLIQVPMKAMGTMFAPWQMLGGPQSLQADVLSNMTENPINPFSLGSVGKVPGFIGSTAGTIGGNIGGGLKSTRLPNGQENPNAGMMLMKQFLSRLGSR